MYMQEALELVCRKRKLDNPKDYALLLADMSILIPLDRTVASLQGKRELVLVKKSMLPQLGHDLIQVAGKTTDPNGEWWCCLTMLMLYLVAVSLCYWCFRHELLLTRVDLQRVSLSGCRIRRRCSCRPRWTIRRRTRSTLFTARCPCL